MWCVIVLIVIFVIAIGAKVLGLGCDIDEIKNNRCSIDSGCEEYVKSILRKHEVFKYHDDYGRRNAEREVKEKIKKYEEAERIRCNMEKKISQNARFGYFKDKEVTNTEALAMLFNYLGLKIEPAGDIKIVKFRKNKK